MKRLLLMCLLLASGPVLAQVALFFSGQATHPAQGSSKASFSDDFNRADSDSLGANWTEAVGDSDIASNTLSIPNTFSFAEVFTIYTGTSCTTADQYVRSTVTSSPTGGSLAYPVYVVRYTDASSPFYEVFFDVVNNVVGWYRWTAIGGTRTQIGSNQALTLTSPTTIGITCAGTGNSTVIRIWISPPSNTPTSASNWGGDTTPDITFTDDPSTPVNTGSKVGLGAIANGIAQTHDDFFGGDIP